MTPDKRVEEIRERWTKWLEAERDGGDWFAPYPVDLELVDDTLAHIDKLEAHITHLHDQDAAVKRLETENERLREDRKRIHEELTDLCNHDEMGGTARYLLAVLNRDVQTMRESIATRALESEGEG